MVDTVELLKHDSYDFLRQNKELENIIYLTLSGSHAYGTNKEQSDVDLRGILVEPKNCMFGLGNFEQFEERATDTVIFGLKKYVSLCVNANPNALELLGTPEECIVIMNEAGKQLRANIDLFLSQRVIQSFGNYALAQLRRLTNALYHDQYTSKEQQQYLAKLLNQKMDHFNMTYQEVKDGSLMVSCSEDELNPELLLNVNLMDYPLKDFSGIYSEMNSIVKTHGQLNHRNRKKDEMHLYKHAMHLIRLLMTGTDILMGKGVITRRDEETSLLMSIRNGEYSFEYIFELSEVYKEKFNEAAKNTNLPKQPNIEAIEQMMQEIYAESMFG